MKIEGFSYRQRNKIFFDQVDFYFEDCQLNFILGQKKIGKTQILDAIANINGIRDDHFIGFPKDSEIAYLAQENGFSVTLDVSEIIYFARQLNDVSEFEVPDLIKNVWSSRFSDLTGEYKKLVLIYLNTMVEKELYLFDEPEKELSLVHSQAIFGWFRELVELGKTIIITSDRLDNIRDINNVNYVKNSREVLSDNYLKIKSRMAF